MNSDERYDELYESPDDVSSGNSYNGHFAAPLGRFMAACIPCWKGYKKRLHSPSPFTDLCCVPQADGPQGRSGDK